MVILVGYVSDERYIALTDAALEFRRGDIVVQARSGASGGVYADLESGEFEVTIALRGFGSKISTVDVSPERPHHFRLLSDCLLGYMWPKCLKSGEKSEFRLHSHEAYKLELWRYGWEKEFIRAIGWYDEHDPRATVQITPDGDYTQVGAQWNKFGYSSPSHKQYLQAPDRSGLYYLHAKTESGDNARLQLDRYTDPEHFNYKTDEYLPLSFERPEPINHVPEDAQVTDPIEGRAPNHIAPAEWRLVAWMDHQGFDYDYYSETQFHFEKLNLDDYKVLVLGPHPEYWSSVMYFELKDWVFNRGGRLMYLGGNGLNCEVEFLDEATMVVHNGKLKEATEAGYESRFHVRHESEANLLGVVFTESGIMTAAPYQVVDESHWAFEGTGLKNGDVFGQEFLHMRIPGGASGHETDKISPFSPKNTKLLARGRNPDDGGAVFSTGSITWISSLPVSDSLSKITANVVQRFLQ